MATYAEFNPYLDIPAEAARTTAKTTVSGSDTVTIPSSSPRQRVDYELQDYFDDTGIPPPHRLSAYSSTSVIPSSRNSTHNSTSPWPRSVAPAAAEEPLMAPSGPNYYEYGWTQDNRGLEKQQAAKKRSKWLIIGGLVSLLALIGIAAGVGISISHSHKSSGSSPAATDSDPSKFDKDPALLKSFYGIAYTPEGSQLPECGANLTGVIQDIQLLSQLTTRIRLYGADCNQTSLVMDAIQRTKVNMTVYIGNYAISTDNNTAYQRQRDEIVQAIDNFGVGSIGGITVGNEFMLNYLTAHGSNDPNSAIAGPGAELLIADIDDTRSNLTSLSLTKTLPVGTSDAGSYFNNEVLEQVDYLMANVHPFFANQSIDQAAGWVFTFFETVNVAQAANTTKKPEAFIAETGWPTGSTDAASGNNGASNASEANLQTFMDDFVCAANANGTGYFFFEYFDEPWKSTAFGGVEGFWGLFYSNRTLKNLKMPTCVLD